MKSLETSWDRLEIGFGADTMVAGFLGRFAASGTSCGFTTVMPSPAEVVRRVRLALCGSLGLWGRHHDARADLVTLKPVGKCDPRNAHSCMRSCWRGHFRRRRATRRPLFVLRRGVFLVEVLERQGETLGLGVEGGDASATALAPRTLSVDKAAVCRFEPSHLEDVPNMLDMRHLHEVTAVWVPCAIACACVHARPIKTPLLSLFSLLRPSRCLLFLSQAPLLNLLQRRLHAGCIYTWAAEARIRV